ncbi:MAG: serine protein kinase RIO [Deltaproteobacteria bacterium]|nr:serine protein kinase RIO [Deltaproteobacteria bacterium]
MRIPKRIEPLVEEGLIDEVVRPLMSGKEAAVYLVVSRGELCCAKVYKESTERTFRQRAAYQEGRTVRNSRRARAMEKGTRFGKRELEEAWQSAEVDALYKLAAAGVSVPTPHVFEGGVLIMEMVSDGEGNPAPRLGEVEFTPDEAKAMHQRLIQEVVRMLCAGLVHGDLSEYNILVGPNGPVIIDLPQAVNAAGNQSAKAILCRDVTNLAHYLGRFAPELLRTAYGPEMWELYSRGELTPDTALTGRFDKRQRVVDVGGVMREIDTAREEAMRRMGREVVDVRPPGKPKPAQQDGSDAEQAPKPKRKRRGGAWRRNR